MRIGLLAPPWVPVPPSTYGGTEAVIDRLARGFQDRGHQVMLWTVGDSTCPVPKGFCYDRDQSERIGSATVELRQVITGYQWLGEWGADIIHDHTMVGPVYSRRFSDIPVVTTNHGPFTPEALDIYAAATPRVAVIAISRDQASRSDSIPIAKVIHHGIDVDQIPIGAGSGDESGKYLLFLGRMAPEKGIAGAIEVARRTRRRLLVAAKMREAAEKDFFAKEIEPCLDDQIVFLGEVDNEQKMHLLRNAQALLSPICWPEPFGLMMIESLACGTPVVSLSAGSAPEIVRDGVNGLLCRSLNEMVERIAEVEAIDREQCRRDAEERFQTSRMVEEHLELFHQILRLSEQSTD